MQGTALGQALPSVFLALGCFALHAVANGHYVFFRDEPYFIV